MNAYSSQFKLSVHIPAYIICGPMETHTVTGRDQNLEKCGGYLVLSLLVDTLNRLGWKALYVGVDDRVLAARYKNGIESGAITVIYPEIFPDNPLHAKKIVRWILYETDATLIDRWQAAGDLIFYYDPSFGGGRFAGKRLFVTDIDPAILPDRRLPRNGICYRIGKGFHYHRKFTYHNSTALLNAYHQLAKTRRATEAAKDNIPMFQIPEELTKDQMIELFNRFLLFVSYDTASATSLIAALCGCHSLIVPRPGFGKTDLPLGLQFGIAYGIADLPNALAEAPGLASRVYELREQCLDTVRQFIQQTQARSF